MKIFKNIFITYPKPEIAESVTLSLQTLSKIRGFPASLPNRSRLTPTCNDETKLRIRNAQFVLAFCLNGLTKILKEELNYSISINKPIIILYDKKRGQKVNFRNYTNVKEIFVDSRNTDEAIHLIAEFIKKISTKKIRSNNVSLGVDLTVSGLELLGLYAFFKENNITKEDEIRHWKTQSIKTKMNLIYELWSIFDRTEGLKPDEQRLQRVLKVTKIPQG